VETFKIGFFVEFNALEFDTNELELVEKGGNSDVYFKLACLFLARKDFTFVQYGQYDVDTTKTGAEAMKACRRGLGKYAKRMNRNYLQPLLKS
jgi:hypothetical protein